MKSKFAAIIIVLLLFIPSAIAVGNYYAIKNAPLGNDNVETISMSDLDGRSHVFKKNDPDTAIADMFTSILEANEKSDKVSGGLPEPLRGTKFYAVSFHGLDQTLTYQYYFKSDSLDAYFVNSEAVTYKLPAEFVAKFQNTKYALSLYDSAIAPSLTLDSDNVLVPNTLSWNYKLADGTYAANNTIASGEMKDSYFLDGGIKLDFTTQPDKIDVKVYDGNSEIYSDSYQNLVNLKFGDEANIKIEVSAEWYQDEERNYYGAATYSFNAQIPAPAAFAVNKVSIDPGDFILVSVSNVYDLAKLTFGADPVINYQPTFFLDGTTARALVPVSYELSGGIYKMTLGYGDISKDIEITVSDKKFKTSASLISASVEAATRTEQTLAEFDQTMGPIAKNGSSTLYFDGKGIFYDYVVKNNYPIVTGIGLTKRISATGTEYRHNGVDFKVNPGKDVAAVMDGEVVFVGQTTLSGNIVVIEHGLGLKSWYAHLSSASVAVGDKVTLGQVIAKSGDTGFTNGQTLHLGLTVFDVPVSIYPLWENDGLVIVDPGDVTTPTTPETPAE